MITEKTPTEKAKDIISKANTVSKALFDLIEAWELLDTTTKTEQKIFDILAFAYRNVDSKLDITDFAYQFLAFVDEAEADLINNEIIK